MGFRDNLQHLRTTRNMTQAELAMILGVSRQSVAKWEAEKSYPEMDKLIKLCDLFECTLDDLVRGDLTGRALDLVRSLPEDASPVDACGYNGHMRRRSWLVPSGFALFIAGFGAATTATMIWVPNPGMYPYLAYFLCAAAGLGLLVKALFEHGSFWREHPYVEDFYTEEQRSAARRQRKRCGVVACALAAVALFLASPGALALVDAMNLWGPVMSINRLAPVLFFGALAVAFALVLHGVMAVRLTNVARYNRASEKRSETTLKLAAALQGDSIATTADQDSQSV